VEEYSFPEKITENNYVYRIFIKILIQVKITFE